MTTEIQEEIRNMKHGKAARPDQIPTELINTNTEAAIKILHILINKIWEE